MVYSRGGGCVRQDEVRWWGGRQFEKQLSITYKSKPPRPLNTLVAPTDFHDNAVMLLSCTNTESAHSHTHTHTHTHTLTRVLATLVIIVYGCVLQTHTLTLKQRAQLRCR